MAIVLEQSLAYAVAVPDDSATTTSWTPGSNELLLCCIAMRGGSTPDAYVTGVVGNGLTWVKVLSEDDTQNVICLSIWRALGPSPTAGGVTVAWPLEPVAASIQLLRFSGVDTGGTNGSAAIGDTDSTDTGATDTSSPTASVTTTRANSVVLGVLANRNRAVSVGSGHTAISINQTASTGGSTARSSTERKSVASSATATTVDYSMSSADDWVLAALEILAQPAGTIVSPAAASVTSGANGAVVYGGIAPDTASAATGAAVGAVIDGRTAAPAAANVVSGAAVGAIDVSGPAVALTLKRRNTSMTVGAR